MQNDDKFYRLVCESVDLIVLVKQLTSAEESKLFKYVKNLVKEIDSPLTISKYQKYILSKVLVDPLEFFDKLPKKDPSAEVKIVHAVFETILDVYPMLDIKLLCSNLNHDGALLSNLGDILKLDNSDLLQLGDNVVDALKKNNALEVEVLEEYPKSSGMRVRSIEDINKIEKFLKRKIIGQEEAIEVILKALKVIASGLDTRSALFFIGPTGVGKTEIARMLGERYSGNFLKLNCAEFSSAHEYAKLIGAPPGYVGHGDKGILAEKAEISNRWVFLFDEIEKAHYKLFDFLLSLLDEGSVCDNLGKELDFSQSIFVFTSNQGVSDFRGEKRVGFSDESVTYENSRDEVEKSIRKKFTPEFLNRVDSFVYFNSLSEEDCLKIAKLCLKGIPIKRNVSLLRWIVKNGYSVEYGARNIKRFIKNNVGVIIADMILQNKIPRKQGSLYTPKIVGNKLKIVDTVDMKNRDSQTNDISGT